jgi:hypothetical protein
MISQIVGMDISLTSTGIVKIELDDYFEFAGISWRGFTDKKYISEKFKENFWSYQNKQFENYIERNMWMRKLIDCYISGASCIAVEDYSFGSVGKNFHVGGFTESIKESIYKSGIPLRWYDIVVIKQLASGNGNADKTTIQKCFDEPISSLIVYPDFILKPWIELQKQLTWNKWSPDKSPRMDIIDAFFITCLLWIELKLRKGLINLKDLDEKIITIFNRVTKSQKENILARSFLERKSIWTLVRFNRSILMSKCVPPIWIMR